MSTTTSEWHFWRDTTHFKNSVKPERRIHWGLNDWRLETMIRRTLWQHRTQINKSSNAFLKHWTLVKDGNRGRGPLTRQGDTMYGDEVSTGCVICYVDKAPRLERAIDNEMCKSFCPRTTRATKIMMRWHQQPTKCGYKLYRSYKLLDLLPFSSS